jgi:hypothetical protein
MVEELTRNLAVTTENPRVCGSSPPLGTIISLKSLSYLKFPNYSIWSSNRVATSGHKLAAVIPDLLQSDVPVALPMRKAPSMIHTALDKRDISEAAIELKLSDKQYDFVMHIMSGTCSLNDLDDSGESLAAGGTCFIVER